MAVYVKVEGGIITDRSSDKEGPNSVLDGDGFPVWRPATSTPAPAHDSATHHAPARTQGINVGDAVAINGPDVTEAWAAPVAKTAGEIDTEKTARADGIVLRPELRLAKLQLVGLFWAVNEIRTLKGQGTVTAAQFITSLDAMAGDISDTAFRNRMKDLL